MAIKKATKKPAPKKAAVKKPAAKKAAPKGKAAVAKAPKAAKANPAPGEAGHGSGSVRAFATAAA